MVVGMGEGEGGGEAKGEGGDEAEGWGWGWVEGVRLRVRASVYTCIETFSSLVSTRIMTICPQMQSLPASEGPVPACRS